jgi:hypothetical protein
LVCQAEKPLSYRDAGVDIDAGNELVRRIQKLNPQIGGFSGMVPFGRPLPAFPNALRGDDMHFRCVFKTGNPLS